MPCEMPPELDDVQLLAALDGEADAQVAEHLEGCRYCRSRAARLARLQGQLTARLYRLDCPRPEELGEYQMGLLEADRAATIRQHLDGCPLCQREMAEWQRFEQALAPDLKFSPRERIQIWIGRLVESVGKATAPGLPALAPAYAPVRGEAVAPRVYEAGDARVALEVEPDLQDPTRRALLGLVTGVPFSELSAHLWQAGEEVAAAPVDELGNFEIAGLAPAHYDLILAGPEFEIHIQDLDV